MDTGLVIAIFAIGTLVGALCMFIAIMTFTKDESKLIERLKQELEKERNGKT